MEDKAVDIREGEELDKEKVRAFLEENVGSVEGELEIKQFPGGFSNLTYLLKDNTKEMVLRRPPKGADIKSAHDMGREYKILSALKPLFPYCPEPLAYTEDESVLGCPFYIMEKIQGIILRKELPGGLSIKPEQADKLCKTLLDVHVELHSIDVEKNNLSFLGKPEGYVKRQVEGWSRRYENAKTEDAPAFKQVMEWLKDKMPEDTKSPSIIHNDYKFDNVVLDKNNPMKIIGVLDWEMATYGDPLMDLGSSLGYWIDRNDPDEFKMLKTMPTDIDGALTRQEMIERYGEKTGLNMDKFDFYLCFGTFRLAVIAQQIYKRFYLGYTKDPRFGMLIHAVNILEKVSNSIIDKSRI
ncbi:MAG: phosphotransferase family protein [Deltaproteobacteria bacterium]|nr:MAG: phosphotransferase family protein [Deltaproteobacteria bacterium]